MIKNANIEMTNVITYKVKKGETRQSFNGYNEVLSLVQKGKKVVHRKNKMDTDRIQKHNVTTQRDK